MRSVETDLARQVCAAAVKNPVAASAESTTAGGTPSELTGAHWNYGSSDGELISVIHDGTSQDMAGYAERMSDPDIWNVVNYIRHLER